MQIKSEVVASKEKEDNNNEEKVEEVKRIRTVAEKGTINNCENIAIINITNKFAFIKMVIQDIKGLKLSASAYLI